MKGYLCPRASGSQLAPGTQPPPHKGQWLRGSCPPGPPCTVGTALWAESRPASALGAERGLGGLGAGLPHEAGGLRAAGSGLCRHLPCAPPCSRPPQPLPGPCPSLGQQAGDACYLVHHIPGASSTRSPATLPRPDSGLLPQLSTCFPAHEGRACCLWAAQVAPRSPTPCDLHPQGGAAVSMLGSLHVRPKRRRFTDVHRCHSESLSSRLSESEGRFAWVGLV